MFFPTLSRAYDNYIIVYSVLIPLIYTLDIKSYQWIQWREQETPWYYIDVYIQINRSVFTRLIKLISHLRTTSATTFELQKNLLTAAIKVGYVLLSVLLFSFKEGSLQFKQQMLITQNFLNVHLGIRRKTLVNRHFVCS